MDLIHPQFNRNTHIPKHRQCFFSNRRRVNPSAPQYFNKYNISSRLSPQKEQFRKGKKGKFEITDVFIVQSTHVYSEIEYLKKKKKENEWHNRFTHKTISDTHKRHLIMKSYTTPLTVHNEPNKQTQSNITQSNQQHKRTKRRNKTYTHNKLNILRFGGNKKGKKFCKEFDKIMSRLNYSTHAPNFNLSFSRGKNNRLNKQSKKSVIYGYMHKDIVGGEDIEISVDAKNKQKYTVGVENTLESTHTFSEDVKSGTLDFSHLNDQSSLTSTDTSSQDNYSDEFFTKSSPHDEKCADTLENTHTILKDSKVDNIKQEKNNENKHNVDKTIVSLDNTLDVNSETNIHTCITQNVEQKFEEFESIHFSITNFSNIEGREILLKYFENSMIVTNDCIFQLSNIEDKLQSHKSANTPFDTGTHTPIEMSDVLDTFDSQKIKLIVLTAVHVRLCDYLKGYVIDDLACADIEMSTIYTLAEKVPTIIPIFKCLKHNQNRGNSNIFEAENSQISSRLLAIRNTHFSLYGHQEKLCLCGQPSYGLMISCENRQCRFGEWFHFACVGITKEPSEDWRCPGCSCSDVYIKAWKLLLTIQSILYELNIINENCTAQLMPTSLKSRLEQRESFRKSSKSNTTNEKLLSNSSHVPTPNEKSKNDILIQNSSREIEPKVSNHYNTHNTNTTQAPASPNIQGATPTINNINKLKSPSLSSPTNESYTIHFVNSNEDLQNTYYMDGFNRTKNPYSPLLSSNNNIYNTNVQLSPFQTIAHHSMVDLGLTSSPILHYDNRFLDLPLSLSSELLLPNAPILNLNQTVDDVYNLHTNYNPNFHSYVGLPNTPFHSRLGEDELQHNIMKKSLTTQMANHCNCVYENNNKYMGNNTSDNTDLYPFCVPTSGSGIMSPPFRPMHTIYNSEKASNLHKNESISCESPSLTFKPHMSSTYPPSPLNLIVNDSTHTFGNNPSIYTFMQQQHTYNNNTHYSQSNYNRNNMYNREGFGDLFSNVPNGSLSNGGGKYMANLSHYTHYDDFNRANNFNMSTMITAENNNQINGISISLENNHELYPYYHGTYASSQSSIYTQTNGLLDTHGHTNSTAQDSNAYNKIGDEQQQYLTHQSDSEYLYNSMSRQQNDTNLSHTHYQDFNAYQNQDTHNTYHLQQQFPFQNQDLHIFQDVYTHNNTSSPNNTNNIQTNEENNIARSMNTCDEAILDLPFFPVIMNKENKTTNFDDLVLDSLSALLHQQYTNNEMKSIDNINPAVAKDDCKHTPTLAPMMSNKVNDTQNELYLYSNSNSTQSSQYMEEISKHTHTPIYNHRFDVSTQKVSKSVAKPRKKAILKSENTNDLHTHTTHTTKSSIPDDPNDVLVISGMCWDKTNQSWRVCGSLKNSGRRRYKYFKASKFGSQKAAMEAAIAFQNEHEKDENYSRKFDTQYRDLIKSN